MEMFRNKQRGVSFSGFIMVAFLLVFAALLGMKIVPAYLHSAQISQTFKDMAADASLRGASVNDIEMSYRKRASINDINDISVEDIVIENESGILKLSANYAVKIPLVANITLLLEFNPSSDK